MNLRVFDEFFSQRCNRFLEMFPLAGELFLNVCIDAGGLGLATRAHHLADDWQNLTCRVAASTRTCEYSLLELNNRHRHISTDYTGVNIYKMPCAGLLIRLVRI